MFYHVVVDDQDVRDCVAVRVCQVVVGAAGEDEAVALLLAKHSREAQGVLAPGHVPVELHVKKWQFNRS